MLLNNDHLLRFLFLYFGTEAKANQNALYSWLNFASFTLLTKQLDIIFLFSKCSSITVKKCVFDRIIVTRKRREMFCRVVSVLDCDDPNTSVARYVSC